MTNTEEEGLDIQFWEQIPKVELHVHLGGCITQSTLAELSIAKGVPPPKQYKRSTLEECFEIFKAIHTSMCTLDDLARVTKETVLDFARDNVKYLELRTTPRQFERDHSTEKDYLECVMQSAAQIIHEKNLDIEVGILVSEDRSKKPEKGLEDAKTACSLATSHDPQTAVPIIGMELSGNPYVGDFGMLRPALDYVRTQGGLPVTIHMAEIQNKSETEAILEWGPQRVGHSVCVDSDLCDLMVNKYKMPVEICLTSNIFSKSIASPVDHPFVKTRKRYPMHPVCFCTDDPGVFQTSMSREYAMAERDCGFSRDELLKICRESVDLSFAPQSTKDKIKSQFDAIVATKSN